MPLRLNWEPKGVHAEFHDHVTVSEITRMLEKVCADLKFQDFRYLIVDYLHVTSHSMTKDDAVWVGALDAAQARWNPLYVTAFVACEAATVEFAQHSIFASKLPERVGCFPSVADARAWIETKKGEVFVPPRGR